MDRTAVDMDRTAVDMDRTAGKCSQCPYHKSERVLGIGQRGGICIVGEAPGVMEIVQKRPFIGESGKLLRSVLSSAGINPEKCYITNALLCQPYKEMPDGSLRTVDVSPSMDAVRACRDRLMAEIEEVAPTSILAVGAVGTTALLGSPRLVKITEVAGRWTEVRLKNGLTIPMLPTLHPAAVLRSLRGGNDGSAREFIAHIEKFARGVPRRSDPVVQVVVPQSAKDALFHLKLLRDASLLACDVETTGLNPFSDSLLCVGIGALRTEGGGFSVVIPRVLLDDASVQQAIRDLLFNNEALCVFHNLKFDIKFLWKWLYPESFLTDGVVPKPRRAMDTLLLHYAYDERTVKERAHHGLKSLAAELCDAPEYDIDVGHFLSLPEEERNYSLLYQYNGLDCYYTLEVYEKLTALCKEDTGDDRLIRLVAEFLVPASYALAKVELYGVGVDMDKLAALCGDLVVRRDEALSTLRELVGNPEFNPASWQQVAKVLYDGEIPKKASKEEPLTGEHVLLSLEKDKEKGPFCQKLLEYRRITKILSTYIRGALAAVDPTTQRIHTTFLLHGTSTGRLSSRNPNMQNIPNTEDKFVGAFRDVFVAPPGYVLVECDYSQLELRVAAWYSQDAKMVQIFRDGTDIHDSVARAVFRIPPEQPVSKIERTMAKHIDFGTIYGLSAYGLVKSAAMDELEASGGRRWELDEAQRFIDNFLNQFPKLREWLNVTKRRAVRYGFVETPMNRRRRFPIITPDSVGEIERQAVNMPIQSLASDICLSALVRLVERLPCGARPVLAVHDSILFEVREDLVDEIVPTIIHEMRDNIPMPNPLGIPFEVKVKIGKRWGSLREIQ